MSNFNIFLLSYHHWIAKPITFFFVGHTYLISWAGIIVFRHKLPMIELMHINYIHMSVLYCSLLKMECEWVYLCWSWFANWDSCDQLWDIAPAPVAHSRAASSQTSLSSHSHTEQKVLELAFADQAEHQLYSARFYDW